MVILKYGNCMEVRRKFRIHFKLPPFKIPNNNSFKSLVDRFTKTGDVRAWSKRVEHLTYLKVWLKR